MTAINYPWNDIRDWTPARVVAAVPLMFAYGSNINPRQAMFRAPNCEFVSTARLNYSRMRFYGDSAKRGGVATLRPTTSHDAFAVGVLYRMTAEDIKFMDLSEGNGTTYARYVVTVIADGQPVQAFTYIRLSNVKAGPTDEYVDRIRKGFRFFGLDMAKLDRAVELAPPCRVVPDAKGDTVDLGSPLAVRQPRQGRPTGNGSTATPVIDKMLGRGSNLPATLPGTIPVKGTYRAPQGRPSSRPPMSYADMAAAVADSAAGFVDDASQDWTGSHHRTGCREPGPDET